MNQRNRQLTDAEIRASFFIVPLIGIVIFFGGSAKARMDFFARRNQIEETGGELLVIGWPERTTISYHRLHQSNPLDIDCIVETYKISVAMKKVLSQ